MGINIWIFLENLWRKFNILCNLRSRGLVYEDTLAFTISVQLIDVTNIEWKCAEKNQESLSVFFFEKAPYLNNNNINDNVTEWERGIRNTDENII
jgi:hypothetical protein